MAIATGTALLASAAIGGAATLYGASKGAKAAQQAGELEYRASQENLALQKQIYEQSRADNEWQRQLGMSAGSALSTAFGLSAPGPTSAPSMTGKSYGGYAGTSPVEGYPVGPMTGGADYAAYVAQYPDVAAEGRRVLSQTPGYIGDLNGDGQETVEDYGVYHAKTFNDRPVPTLQTQAPPAPSMTGGAQTQAPAGYSDPTAAGGYTMADRTPMAPLNISAEAFRADPGYEFAVEQGNKALGNIASANRGLMSGQRMKAAARYNVGIADQEFDDWRSYTTSQYNTDRGFNESVYQADRGRLDQRYDQRNNTLLSMAGFGQTANAQNQSAAQSFGANSANLTMTGAQAKGNAGVNAANAWSQGIGNLVTTGAYMAGQGSFNRPMTVPGAESGYVVGYNPSWIGS